jgi:hypothetical protein
MNHERRKGDLGMVFSDQEKRIQTNLGEVLSRLGLLGVALFNLALAGPTVAQESTTEPDPAVVGQAHGRAQLEDLLSPLLEGGGTWRAANHDHTSGDAKSPAFFRLEHEWLFERTLMRYRILGEFEDGRKEVYWEGSVFWDPREEKASVIQIHRVGIVGLGDVSRQLPDSVRFAVTFWHPGGGSEPFRDEMKFTSRTTMESLSQGYDPTDWKWIEKRREHWTLVEEPAVPGESSED